MYCDCDVFMVYKLTIFTVNINKKRVKRKTFFAFIKKNYINFMQNISSISLLLRLLMTYYDGRALRNH